MGWSLRLALLEYTCSMASVQEWDNSSGLSIGISVVELRVWHTLRVTLGELRRRAWYFVRWPPVSHWWPLISNTPCTYCGVNTSRCWPMVSFVASLTSKTMAAMALRQPGHPEATVSHCLERHATGYGTGPLSWWELPGRVSVFLR